MLATQYLEMRSFCDVMEKILQHNIPINFKSLGLGLGLGLARLFSLGLGLANQDHFQVLLMPIVNGGQVFFLVVEGGVRFYN